MDNPFHIFGLIIALLVVTFGLLIAVVSPFGAYRYLSAPERRAPGLIRRWLWETSQGEYVAAYYIALGGSIGSVFLLPPDSELVRALFWIVFVTSLVVTVSAPFQAYRRLSITGAGTHDRGTLRSLLWGMYPDGLWAAGACLYSASVLFLPGTLLSWLLLFLAMAETLAFSIIRIVHARRDRTQWRIADLYVPTGMGAIPQASQHTTFQGNAKPRRPFRSGQKKGTP
jgi:hypothetical protein